MRLLPVGFEDLEEFVAFWAVPTAHERWMQRSSASFEDIQRFYDAVLARAEAAKAYLDQYPLDAMPEDAGRLLLLLLALTQAAMAVELHRAPRVPHSTFPHGLTIDAGIQPFG